MKAILEFNLPEESEEYKTVINANDYKNALIEFRNYMRAKSKHDDSLNESQYELLEQLRETFFGILIDNDVQL